MISPLLQLLIVMADAAAGTVAASFGQVNAAFLTLSSGCSALCNVCCCSCCCSLYSTALWNLGLYGLSVGCAEPIIFSSTGEAVLLICKRT